jgi:hypothetical protein
MVDDHTREKISHNEKRISPETNGVIVDDHTREKISHSGKRISPETKSRVILFFQSVIFFSLVWSSTITPSTKGSTFVYFFIILNASSKEDFEFLLELVNQWNTL